MVTGASRASAPGSPSTRRRRRPVVVNYASSKTGADRWSPTIFSAGGKAIAVQADVAKSADVKPPFDAVTEDVRRLDILVNNAGVFEFAPLEQFTEALPQTVQRQRARRAARHQEALPHFGGKAAASSISVRSPAPTRFANSVVYSASKSAVDAMTKALANELAGRKIRVNASRRA